MFLPCGNIISSPDSPCIIEKESGTEFWEWGLGMKLVEACTCSIMCANVLPSGFVGTNMLLCNQLMCGIWCNSYGFTVK